MLKNPTPYIVRIVNGSWVKSPNPLFFSPKVMVRHITPTNCESNKTS